MINIEAVSQTGAGVYVAVLDTDLVPNWCDYFPEERIATDLSTGFDQLITFKAKKADPCGLYDLFPVLGFYTYSWGTNATGAGLHQVDAAIAHP